jgi:hypothetical protein
VDSGCAAGSSRFRQYDLGAEGTSVAGAVAGGKMFWTGFGVTAVKVVLLLLLVRACEVAKRRVPGPGRDCIAGMSDRVALEVTTFVSLSFGLGSGVPAEDDPGGLPSVDSLSESQRSMTSTTLLLFTT